MKPERIKGSSVFFTQEGESAEATDKLPCSFYNHLIRLVLVGAFPPQELRGHLWGRWCASPLQEPPLDGHLRTFMAPHRVFAPQKRLGCGWGLRFTGHRLAEGGAGCGGNTSRGGALALVLAWQTLPVSQPKLLFDIEEHGCGHG